MTVYEEIFQAAQPCKPKQSQENEDDFLKRLVEEISKVNDATWDSLSVNAQNWFNTAAVAVNAMKPLPAFPDATVSKTENANAIDPKYVAVIPIKLERPQRLRSNGVIDAIRIAAIQHAGWSKQQIYDSLKNDWPSVNINTIAVNIGDIYRVIELAKGMGYWNDKPNDKPETKT